MATPGERAYQPTSVRLPTRVHRDLKKRAASLDRTIGEHIRTLVEADLYGTENLVPNARFGARMAFVSAIFLRRILDDLLGEQEAARLQVSAFKRAEEAAK